MVFDHYVINNFVETTRKAVEAVNTAKNAVDNALQLYNSPNPPAKQPLELSIHRMSNELSIAKYNMERATRLVKEGGNMEKALKEVHIEIVSV